MPSRPVDAGAVGESYHRRSLSHHTLGEGGAMTPPSDRLDVIDGDLKALKQFCIRVGKVPYIRERGLSTFTRSRWSTDTDNWLSFDEAVEAFAKGARVSCDEIYQPVTGIGFLCHRGKTPPFILGGDLDGCRDPETGELSTWSRTFLETVQPFYSEVSLSGCGVRFFVYGRLPGGPNSITGYGPQDDLSEEVKERIAAAKPSVADKLTKGLEAFNGFEVYEAARHLTLTGDKLPEFCYEKEDRSEQIAALLMPFVKEEADLGEKDTPPTDWRAIPSQGKGWLPTLRIEDVIDTHEFSESGGQLFGPHPTLGSTTGKNLVVNPVKNVYAYMHDGINKGGDPWVWLACEAGVCRWEDAGRGALTDTSVIRRTVEHACQRGLISAEEATQLCSRKADAIRIEDLTTVVGREPVFDAEGVPVEPKEYRVKRRLSPSKSVNAILDRGAVGLHGDTLWRYADNGLWKPDGDREVSALIDRVAGDVSHAFGLREVLRRVHGRAEEIELDPSPSLLGVVGGVVNCETGQFRECHPEDHITDQIAVNYDQSARCPAILDFIAGITPDYGDRITLLDFIAAGAYRKALYFIGFLTGHGSSGASTFTGLLQRFYGPETTEAVPLKELLSSRFATGSLARSRYSIGQETTISETGTDSIKRITGGDWISSDQKNRDRVRFRAYTKLLFTGNSLPRFTDDSWGFRRRFAEVKLPFRFVDGVPQTPFERPKDTTVDRRISHPEELSGLLNVVLSRLPWIIEHGRIYFEEQAEGEYLETSDSVTAFLSRYCEYYPDTPAIRVPIKSLHTHFKRWAELTVSNQMLDARYFGKIVKQFCDNQPALDTRVDGLHAVVYQGLAFDQSKFDKEIEILESRMKPDESRMKAGREHDRYISKAVSAVSNLNIDPKELWEEIVSLFGPEAPLSSGRLEGSIGRVEQIDPALPADQAFDSGRPSGLKITSGFDPALIRLAPSGRPVDAGLSLPAEAAKARADLQVAENEHFREVAADLGGGDPPPEAHPGPGGDGSQTVRFMKDYRSQFPSEADPHKFVDRFFAAGDVADLPEDRAAELIARGIAELVPSPGRPEAAKEGATT